MADENQPQGPPEVSGVVSAPPAAEEAVAVEAQDVAPLGTSPVFEAKEEVEEEEEGEEEEEEEEKGDAGEEDLALADELFEKGSKLIVDGGLADAVDCLGQSLEIRVKHYGELAQECATAYYKYGCALLYKAQEESDPLGNIPKNTPPKLVKSTSDIEGSGNSKSSFSGSGHDLPNKEEGSSKGMEENSSGGNNRQGHGEEDEEDLAEAEEDESDLDLAWKMLDISRAIVEKHPGDSIDKVNIYATLAEASMEREDMETSLNDYLKALSIAERLGEPNDRRVVELNFRICLLLELDSKIAEAIPYCEKAIFLCKAHLDKLKENAHSISTPAGTLEGCVADSQARATELAGEASSGSSTLVKEIESLSGILSELEKKFEDLQQANESSSSVKTEVANLIGSKQRSGDLNIPRSITGDSSLNSSQMGTIVGGFDSPTISSAGTNGGVTHLGVVGRGTKRSTIMPSSVEPSPKRLMVDPSVERSDSNITIQDSNSLDAKSDE